MISTGRHRPLTFSPLPLPSHLLLPPTRHYTLVFPSLPLRCRLTSTVSRRASSSPATEHELLDAIAMSDGSDALPCVRTYEADLARLTLVGAADFEQALTAAAADGGVTATEHLDAGMDAMVVETVFPGPVEDRTTVSTRLFLPARKVEEKAGKLKRTFPKEMLAGTSSKNILATTFRQVVLQHLWSFQLAVFGPGTVRNMDDLESPRETTISFALSSSDEKVISVLSDALCSSVLERTREHFLEGRFSSGLFGWSRQRREVISVDSSVVIYELSEDEVTENAKALAESFKSAKDYANETQSRWKNTRWTRSTQSKLEKIGGPEFCAWLSEHIPMYRLQINSERFEDLKLEGWKQLSENRWEVVLSHYQMVGLTKAVDVFYEDTYTLPGKEIHCRIIVDTAQPDAKRGTSLMEMLAIAIAGGIIVAAIKVFSQCYLPQVQNLLKCLQQHKCLPSSSETAD